MAGKSNKGRNQRGPQTAANPSEQTVSSSVPSSDHSSSSDVNGNAVPSEPLSTNDEFKESEIIPMVSKGQADMSSIMDEQSKQDDTNATVDPKAKQGDVLYFLHVP